MWRKKREKLTRTPSHSSTFLLELPAAEGGEEEASRDLGENIEDAQEERGGEDEVSFSFGDEACPLSTALSFLRPPPPAIVPISPLLFLY